MAKIYGSNARIGMKVSGTFATAATVAAGDKLEVESIEANENTSELSANPIGSGDLMQNESQIGQTSPTISFEEIMKYDGAGMAGLAVFQGTSAAPATEGAGYAHSMLFNETFNENFLTTVIEKTDSALEEFASGQPTSVTITAENPPNYVKASMEILANKREIDSPTNQTADLANLTLADTERIVIEQADEFLINAQAGSALASPTDRKSIMSAVLTLTKPMEHLNEIKGSAGNSEPEPTGDIPYQGMLEVTFKGLDDLTYFTAHQAGTEYKASLAITGSLIGGSTYKALRVYLPRLRIVEEPQHSWTSPGNNPLTVNFKCLVAASTPSGMLDRYPHFVVINEKSAAYIS